MSYLFKTPKIDAGPKVPTRDDALTALQDRMGLAKRAGRASTIVAGSMGGDSGTATGPATKILLGQ